MGGDFSAQRNTIFSKNLPKQVGEPNIGFLGRVAIVEMKFAIIENPIVTHGEYLFFLRAKPAPKLNSRIQHTVQHLIDVFG